MADASERPWRGFQFVTLVLLNSAWIFYAYLAVTQMGTFEPAKLSRLLEGTAERPYVYRQLMPLLARSLSPVIPQALAEMLSSAPFPIRKTFEALSEGGYHRAAAVVLTLIFFSLVGFAYAQRYFLTTLGLTSSSEQLSLPLLAQVMILPFTIFFGYIYDLPQVLLLTLCLAFLLERRWPGYFIALALASLNKETTVLVIPVFIIYYWSRLPRRTFITLLLAQGGVYAVLRFVLLYLYRDNPGTPMLITLRMHYEQYVAYPPSVLITLVFFAPLIYLMLRGWKHKHPFLRAGFVMFVMLLGLFFLAGMPVEFRVFLDALPVIAALIYMPPIVDPAAASVKTTDRAAQ
jgi:hypothetical protein